MLVISADGENVLLLEASETESESWCWWSRFGYKADRSLGEVFQEPPLSRIRVLKSIEGTPCLDGNRIKQVNIAAGNSLLRLSLWIVDEQISAEVHAIG